MFCGRIPLRYAKTTLENKDEDVFHFYKQDNTGKGEDEDDNNHNKLKEQFKSSLRNRAHKSTNKSQTEREDTNANSSNDDTFEHNERYNSNSNHKLHINNRSNNTSPYKANNRLFMQQRKSELISNIKLEEYATLKQIS